jgi:hypothetical protein
MCALAVCSVAWCLRLPESSLAVVHAWAACVALLVFLWCFTHVSLVRYSCFFDAFVALL